VSNSLAIYAVTTAIRDLLNLVATPLPGDPDPDPDINDATCTTRAPDKARQHGEGHNQLNLFLYQTAWNAALRNADIARSTRPNESAMSPVALNLYYMVTAYGKNHDDLLAHRLLGRAMSLLHDNAILLPGALQAAGKGNDLWKQVERVRITPHPISGEELSKMWATFQTPYRISATYEVAAVLIDSSRRAKAPPPVVGRRIGAQDNLLPAYPALSAIALPLAAQPAARLPSPPPPAAPTGDTLTLTGHDLAGFATSIELAHPLLPQPIVRAPLAGAGDATLQIDLPTDQTIMPAGLYAVSARVSPSADPDQDRVSNTLPLAIAPRIRDITVQPRDASGQVPVTVLCSPQVWPEQRAALIVGDREILAQPHPTKSDTLDFKVPLPAKTYLARLRVDGIDSFLIDYASSPLAYDPTQVVTLP
jgi:hypothetical protein